MSQAIVAALSSPRGICRSPEIKNFQLYRAQIKSWFPEMVKEQEQKALEEEAKSLILNKSTQTEEPPPKNCCIIQ